jgi:hypothetical protein
MAGRLALLLLALYPNNVGYVPLALTEVFYTALLLSGCWLLLIYRAKCAMGLGGVVFGFATLVKAQSLIVIPLIFGIEMLRERIHWRNALRAVGKTSFVIAVSCSIVLPWSYRNYRVFGEGIFISTNGGLTLLTGNNPSARGDFTAKDYLVTSIPRTVGSQVAVDREARRRAIEWIQQNPGRFLTLLPLKLFRLWAPDGESEWAFQAGYKGYEAHVFWFRAVRYINQIYYVCLLAGFVLAGVALFSGRVRISHRRLDWWALPYGLALYPTLIAMIFSGQSRFHYPLMPFVAMACGWLIVFLYAERTDHDPAQVGRKLAVS